MDKKRIIEKLTSKVTWVAAAPLIASLVLKFCGVDIGDTLTTVITLLAVFGILNDPHDREQF